MKADETRLSTKPLPVQMPQHHGYTASTAPVSVSVPRPADQPVPAGSCRASDGWTGAASQLIALSGRGDQPGAAAAGHEAENPLDYHE